MRCRRARGFGGLLGPPSLVVGGARPLDALALSILRRHLERELAVTADMRHGRDWSSRASEKVHLRWRAWGGPEARSVALELIAWPPPPPPLPCPQDYGASLRSRLD